MWPNSIDRLSFHVGMQCSSGDSCPGGTYWDSSETVGGRSQRQPPEQGLMWLHRSLTIGSSSVELLSTAWVSLATLLATHLCLTLTPACPPLVQVNFAIVCEACAIVCNSVFYSTSYVTLCIIWVWNATTRTRLLIDLFPGSRAVVCRFRLIIGEPIEPTFESSFSHSM